MVASKGTRETAGFQQLAAPRLAAEITPRHTGKIAGVVTEISSAAVAVVTEMHRNHQQPYYRTIGNHSVYGIAGRVARETIFHLANLQAPFLELHSGQSEAAEIDVEDIVIDQFHQWWAKRSSYIPSNQLPEVMKYEKEHGGVSETSDLHSILELTDANFFGSSNMREIYDRVRTATYGTISRGNVDLLLPKIHESYKRSTLQAETIEKLARHRAQGETHFKGDVHKGIFVFDFQERVDGNPSIEEQMYDEFTRSPEHSTGYVGKYLMDDDGELLAWLTYWQPPRLKNEQYRSMLDQYLRKGVTGGKMRYSRKPERREFLPYLDSTLMFDTIKGEVPFAANRLFAKSMQDMLLDNSSLEMFIGYRLHELHLNPPLEVYKKPIRLFDNLRSSKFFTDRECGSFATDHNRSGPASIRTLSDGSTVLLNPEWVAFNGRFDDIINASWQKWHSVQRKFGDVSIDDERMSEIKFHRSLLRSR